MKRRLLPLVLPILLSLPLVQEAQSSGFDGRVVVEWIEHKGADRAMRLIEPFSFQDSSGKFWRVPEGSVVDGASIPRALWTVVGPPFVGDYRRASVVHDYYCEVKTEPWQAVHRMFYDAVVSAGVPAFKAKLMYAAVRKGGPRWEVAEIVGFDGKIERFIIEMNPDISEGELRTISEWIESREPSLDEIDAYVEALEGDDP